MSELCEVRQLRDQTAWPKLPMEKLKRLQFGRPSEKRKREIEQLELAA